MMNQKKSMEERLTSVKITGGSFEELTEKQMEELQGSGRYTGSTN